MFSSKISMLTGFLFIKLSYIRFPVLPGPEYTLMLQEGYLNCDNLIELLHILYNLTINFQLIYTRHQVCCRFNAVQLLFWCYA